MSGCVARFREGNGSCVHRFLSPGGGPFCVARGRVFFCHSLSQVSLLGRNLNTVFLRVNNLEDFFSGGPRRAPLAAAAEGRPSGTIDDADMHRTELASSKTLHVSRGFSRMPASVDVAHGIARSGAGIPNGSGTGAVGDVVAARRTRRVPASHKRVCAKTARRSRRVRSARIGSRRRANASCERIRDGAAMPRTAGPIRRATCPTKKAAEIRGLRSVHCRWAQCSSICSA